MTFYDDIKAIMQMKGLKSVAWEIVGSSFDPEKVYVRFEDVEGGVFKLLIHPPHANSTKEIRDQEEVILNVAFSHFEIIPPDHWIGITTDLETMVNMCREKIGYDGVFFVNEEQCRWSDWVSPIYIL